MANEKQAHPIPGSTPHSPAPHAAARPSYPKRPKAAGHDSWRNIISTITILLVAPLFALFLIAFVFQSYLVDGPSMQTTLQDKDRLIVWKVPRTWARITGNPYIPERGEVIVFVEPKLEKFGQSPSKQLIKRVVALPGERVVIENGTLTVYNDENPDGFRPDETMPYGEVVGETPGQLDLTVPEGHIFVAGDNRSNSLDSRAFGPVDANNVVGKLTARFLPLSEAKRF